MNDSQTAVLEIMRTLDGACQKDFALYDINRYSARIHELRGMGYRIVKYRCPRHAHRNVVYQYRVIANPKQTLMYDSVTGGWQ